MTISIFLSVLLAVAPIEMAEILSLKIPQDVILSPQGERIAFTISWTDTTTGAAHSEIRVADTSISEPQSSILVSSAMEPSSPSLSPDGKSVAFYSSKGGSRQVWSISASGGKSKKITNDTPVRSYRWHPAGTGIITLVESAAEKISGRRPREFRLTPLDGNPSRRLFQGDAGIGDWDVDAHGKRIVYSSNGTGIPDHENRLDLFIFSIGDEKSRRLTSRFGPESHPRFSPDGEQVAFQADQDTTVTFSQEEVFVVSAEGGEPRCLTLRYDFPVTEAWWTDEVRLRLYAQAEARVMYQSMFVDAATGYRPHAKVSDDSIAREARFSLRELHFGQSAAAGILEDGTTWGTVGIRKQGDSWIEVDASLPSSIDDSRRPGLSTVTWHSADGVEIEAVLLTPPGGAPPFPTITMLHGGPYNRVTNRLGGSDTAVVLATHGYLVFMPNYRGSKGYGEAFAQALRGDPGRLEIDDVNTGLDSLISQGLADPEKLGILGWSYGGYLTNLTITKTDRFKAAVTMYGMSSLKLDYETGESPSYEVEYLGGTPEEKPDLYRERSPLTFVDRIHTPLLLLHGDVDRKVRIAHATAMEKALKDLGRPVELVRYAGAGHGFGTYEYKVDAARRTLAWFDRYLRN